jgi:hypothetical protein
VLNVPIKSSIVCVFGDFVYVSRMLLPLLLAVAASPIGTPHIELVTMGEGPMIFERFGHAAICVVYEGKPLQDVCYNYGITNFDDGAKLGLDFLQGKAKFWSDKEWMHRMLRAYERADRTIYTQALPLPPSSVERIIARAESDIREENKYYVYHHFFNNCATRLRDAIDDALDHQLSNAPDSKTLTDKTYRQIGQERLADDSPLNTALIVVSDYVLGRALDRAPTRYESMFLPDKLREEIATRLNAPPIKIAQQTDLVKQNGTTGKIWELLFALVLALPVAIGHFFFKPGIARRLFWALPALMLGLIGTIVWALPILSSVPELKITECWPVFLPTDFALPFLPEKWLAKYVLARIGLVVLSLLLLLVHVFCQPLFLPSLAVLLPMLATFAARKIPSSKSTKSPETSEESKPLDEAASSAPQAP